LQIIDEELQKALVLDANDADVHRILAALRLHSNEHDKAAYQQERALSLNPNSDLIVVQQGEVLTWLGRPEEGIEWIRRAMRLNPYHPERFWSHLGRAQYTGRAYADAIASYSKLTALTTRITRFWRPRRRSSATAPRPAPTPARCCRGSRLLRLKASSARCTIATPPMASTCARAC
jgi:Tfp pilus assembly protein PilF